MPMTPFHFSPGICIKSMNCWMSLTSFVAVNVIIDLEPILAYLIIGDPIHGYLHTLAGATLLAVLFARFGRSGCEACLRFWNTRLSPAQAEWLGTDPTITPGAALAGALVGTWSHLLLDGIMHVDIRPLWPLTSSNPFLQFISLDFLHVLCAGLGLWGILRLATQRWDAVRKQRQSAAGLSRLDRLDAVTLRFFAGFARSLVGVCTVCLLVAAPIYQTLEAEMTGGAFNSDQWKAVSSLPISEKNPRLGMTRDLERHLLAKRPDRDQVVALLGAPGSHLESEEFWYTLGRTGDFGLVYLLVVSFGDDGRVASVRIHRD